MENDWADRGLEFLYEWFATDRDSFGAHYEFVTIRVVTHLTPEDVLKFRNCRAGILILTPIVYPDGNMSYTMIYIDRVTHLIHCGNTNGDRINCETFNFLCNLEENGRYFHCVQYDYKCERYHEFQALQMIDYFFNYIVYRFIDKPDEFIVRFTGRQRINGFNSSAVQPLDTYEKILQKHPDINEDIRRNITKHIENQRREIIALSKRSN